MSASGWTPPAAAYSWEMTLDSFCRKTASTSLTDPLARPGVLHAPGVFDAVSAKLTNDALREMNAAVDLRGERPELVDGRPEHGARRVDLLGDDDEPHARLLATARSTSARTLSAYSSGV